MEFEIQPKVGVGPLRFGMSRSEAREAFKPAQIRSFGSDTATPSDHFIDPGSNVLVYYTDDGMVEAVEFARGAQPVLAGRRFLGQPFREAVDSLRELDPGIQVEHDGATSNHLGIGFYAPSAGREKDALVEGVIVFREGYYG